MFLGKFIFIMLSVMASPHVYQEAKIKKKSNDYWKDTILMGPLLDKKKKKSVSLWFDQILGNWLKYISWELHF